MEKRRNHVRMDSESKSEQLLGEARMETYEGRIAETERVRERKRVRIEKGAVDVLEEPETEMMRRWRFDMWTHLAVTS